VCEKERAERDEFQRNCDAASGASLAGSVGCNAIIPIIGGIVCGASAGVVAHNQCRIRDEKESNLKKCEENNRIAQAKEADKQRQRLQQAEAINAEYSTKQAQVKKKYQALMNDLVAGYVREGFDPKHPDVAQEIERQKSTLEQGLQSEIQAI